MLPAPPPDAGLAPITPAGDPDPLLACLRWFCGREGRSFSAEALTARLPLAGGRLSVEQFPMAAERAGFDSRLLQRPLAQLSPLLLPALLLCRDGQACVLLGRSAEGRCRIWLPEAQAERDLEIATLEENYGGYCLLLAPRHKLEARATQYEETGPKNWFWSALWQYRGLYGQVVLAALLVNLIALALPLFTMNVYDRVVPNRAVETLWVLAVGATLALGFDALLRVLRGWFIDIAGRGADLLLAERMMGQVFNTRLEHRPKSAGSFASQLGEFESVREFFTSATLATLVDLPFALLFVAVIGIIGGPLALVPLLLLPLSLAAAWLMERPLRAAVAEAQREGSQKQAIAVEAVSGLEALKSAGAEGPMMHRWLGHVARAAQAGLRSRHYSSLATHASGFLQQFASIVVVVAGVYLIVDGKLTMGGLIACSILTGRALAPMGALTNLLSRWSRTRVALESLNAIMAQPTERPPERRYLHRPRLDGAISVQQLLFRYPEQAAAALDRVSLEIRPGERVGVLGRIGSGKSTIARLLQGLYQPQEGTLLFDQIDIAQIDPADLRRNVAVVPQDALLFYGTARDNIALSRPDASDAEILAVARISGADSFLRLHPEGYDMVIGERGEGLSGGQRQCIAIARALLLDAPILVLDEPSSAMDDNTERAFVEALEQHLQGRTLVLMTHKPSLLRLVDRLVVLERGKLLLSGPRDAVLEQLRGGGKPAGAAP
ncbi:type I secretion system permease/ATPase [Solimonas sp. K1W22B-7]|uniref:type I secretion system permease/ATPase n=1 Tax=Solimonas sp. K1W22B-7 TaxID=2303331 RepID=UPI000E32FA8E|nr:type I secretion system permease/ATPase [Solimonas sp. K1W22B-7]AXQ31560.1 type I secretion system permease/ATPase [Solimonas sp. K1W22B-7]